MPVPEGGDRKNCGGYRQVTLTSHVLRNFEGALRESIFKHPEINEPLITEQRGFVKNAQV